MISFHDVSFKYIEKKEYILKNINLDIQKGETVLFLGKSGTGKSTILNIINGIIPNYLEGDLSGQVTLNGKNLTSSSIQELSKQIGSVFQNPKSQFFNLDTTDELLFGLSNHRANKEKMEQRLSTTISNLKIKNLVDRNIFQLSGGEKQKIAYSSVYMTDPDIIIFDEPSSNLDSDAIEDLRDLIERLKKEGKTILIAEHRIYYLMDYVDRIVYMDQGEIKEIMSAEQIINMSDEKRQAMGIRSPITPVLHDRFKFSNLGLNDNKKGDLSIKDFSYSHTYGKELWYIPELQCEKNEIIGILGKNGSGKTTLGYTISGILKGKGKMKLSSSNKSLKARHRRKLCSMIMQDVNHQLFLDTVLKELLFLAKKDDSLDKARKIAEKLDLLEYLEAHPLSLSGGQKQRIVIASAIMDGKKIIIFDEPTSGLDFDSMNNVSELIKNIAKDKIIFIISHDIEFVNKICTRVFFLDKGKKL
ncbi:MAG: ATP-binding cassette domain-containing protein [Andreesenia angusta]|nr:ATP-binding cassette domain-containing protein [Andreesenia angusta]